jgi:hypothetical protein
MIHQILDVWTVCYTFQKVSNVPARSASNARAGPYDMKMMNVKTLKPQFHEVISSRLKHYLHCIVGKIQQPEAQDKY